MKLKESEKGNENKIKIYVSTSLLGYLKAFDFKGFTKNVDIKY